MSHNFITNNTTHKSLKGRLNTLINISEELKFLVGFFYFSGWQEIFENLKNNTNLTLKLLVGLQVDQMLNKIVEHGNQESYLSHDEQFNQFMKSLGHAINSEEMDHKAFYEQVEFFLQMFDEGRLIIRKTENPNHAKLYLFRLNEQQTIFQATAGQFITGSSNLTRAGLSNQEEFNVEIRDYGFHEAEQYFDNLWENAIAISENDQRKDFLIHFVKYQSQAASITPFEAYAFVLKTYLDLQQQKQLRPEIENLLEEIGYKKYSYQIDAVNQALSILEQYNGVIIADVVGLGKSVIASLIAKSLGKRGIIICPPGLKGDERQNTGWYGYLNDFKLYDWIIESRGNLNGLAESIQNKAIEIVIIDEAHYFRNQDTADYESLSMICRDKIVILLTATPFNNSPADIFSLLKLFIIPGKSGITIDDDLEDLFISFNYKYKQFSDILKNGYAKDPKKIQKAEKIYKKSMNQPLPINFGLVKRETKRLANNIKNIISPVVIRRNRLDLKKDHLYQQEVGDLSEVQNPIELFYELSPEQNLFYDKVLNHYFTNGGRFKGAIYQPFKYEKKEAFNEEKLDEESNRKYQQQQNLYDFMRRLLVKRFESSFGSFNESINRFLQTHRAVQEFIQRENKYLLDRDLIEKINGLMESDDEEDAKKTIEKCLEDYKNKNIDVDEDIDDTHDIENKNNENNEIAENIKNVSKKKTNKKNKKNNTIYEVNQFELKDNFLSDIENDIKVFEEILEQLKHLNMVENDPKRVRIAHEIKSILDNDKNRKVILFSEYVDTVKHLQPYFEKIFGKRLLVCDGTMSKNLQDQLNSNFNAQYKQEQKNDFDILITSDKLSEGFNLNRAGVIVNYDIPWNPTRVIQRVGRINRIGTKVFDKLYIYNFFPSETGADIVKSREIAAQKMFLIHSSLGEDSKIFAEDEEPNASGLFNKLNKNPDDSDEISTITHIRNHYKYIVKNHPEVIEKINKLPSRVKTAKAFSHYQLNVLRQKGLSLFVQVVKNHIGNNSDYNSDDSTKNNTEFISFEELIPNIECSYDEKTLPLSNHFWDHYEHVKTFKSHQIKKGNSDLSLEVKALENLKVYLNVLKKQELSLDERYNTFIHTLISDIKKYHTLSKKTLRRLAEHDISQKSTQKDLDKFKKEIDWIKTQFGDDYLQRLLKKTEHQKNEVIIAIENIEQK